MIDPKTIFLAAGLLYIALPITAWTILRNRHDRLSVALWCGGGLLLGIGFFLVGLRGTLPGWLAVVGANMIANLGYLLRHLALRRELTRPPLREPALLVWLAVSATYIVADASSAIEAPRIAVALSAHMAGAGWLAWLSWSLFRQRGYRSAAMLSGAYALFSLAMCMRLFTLAGNWEQAAAMSFGIDFALSTVAGLAAALYANLGYIGIALESAQAKALQRAAELAREQAQREQSELRVGEQAALLEERGQLLARREEMLAALAHEVRQPLNNASAALQSAADAMANDDGDRERAAQRLQRANAVLTQVTNALDNTLADAVLLGETAAMSRQDTDIDTWVSLTIADIDPGARQRVHIERETRTRTASMNPGLMRLALRNLVVNALAYSPAYSPVVVRIADSDDPLALLIEVVDQGPGIAAELQPRLFSRGARGANAHMGHGLGLFIVRRVMEMHGGEVRLTPGLPVGLTMTLVIPQAYAE